MAGPTLRGNPQALAITFHALRHKGTYYEYAKVRRVLTDASLLAQEPHEVLEFA